MRSLRSALVTGHLGFKGYWLSAMLQTLGYRVVGYGLQADYAYRSLSSIFGLAVHQSIEGDICDSRMINRVLKDHDPDVIFHLAAQPLVGLSFERPIETYRTNVLGTGNIIQCGALHPAVRVIVNVTTDKVYANRGDGTPFRETDELGGTDPYSGSKVAADQIPLSFASLLQSSETRVANVRAGNVVGGGDWNTSRLIPDLVKAFEDRNVFCMRNLSATRPWQHVLDCVWGYIKVAEFIANGKVQDSVSAWNFAPVDRATVTVGQIVSEACRQFGNLSVSPASADQVWPEHRFLSLDSSKAQRQLFWTPRYSPLQSVKEALDWYQSFHDAEKATYREFIMKPINQYLNDLNDL